jgi:ribonuclease-3
MKNNSAINEFETGLNQLSSIFQYKFKNKKFLVEALTRQSAVAERHKFAGTKNYQRLEFLGDSVLGLVVSDLVYELFPEKREEDLHPLRSFIVKNETLAEYAQKLKIGQFIILGKGEEFQNIRNNKKVLADVVEAIVGAIFMDSGRNYDVTKFSVLMFLKPVIIKDKIYSNYLNEITAYFNKYKMYTIENTPDILTPFCPSDVIQNYSFNDVSFSESSLSELVHHISKPEQLNFPEKKENKNSEKIDLNSSCCHHNININCIPQSDSLKKKHIDSETSETSDNYNRNLKNNFKGLDLQNMISLFHSYSGIEDKLEEIIISNRQNYFTDFELFYISSQETFITSVKSNLSITEVVISLLILKTQYYYENLDIKLHYFSAKFLLNLVVNVESTEDYLTKSISCLLHNGIAEFYRSDYQASKFYLEKCLESILLSDIDISEKISESKYICLNYLGEIAFIEKNMTKLNDHTNTILLFEKDSFLWYKKLKIKMEILNYLNIWSNSENCVKEKLDNVNNLIVEYCKVTYELINTNKLIFHDHLQMNILRYTLNKSMYDLSEFKEYEGIILKNFGPNSFLFTYIYELYIEKLSYQYELKQSIIIIEKVALYSDKILKIILCNFTISSKIFSRCLEQYNKILDNFTNFN